MPGAEIATAEILLDQAEGALRRELLRVKHLIDQDPSTAPALLCLDELIGRSAVGLRLLVGWKVVIAGRPMWARAGCSTPWPDSRGRSFDPTPGTTRDVVPQSAALGGWPIELADTAGLRSCRRPDRSGGNRSFGREQAEADLILAVLDRSEALQAIDLELAASGGHGIVVANKSDLPATWETGDVRVGPKPVVTVSAERGDGIAELCAEIVRSVVPRAPSRETAFRFGGGTGRLSSKPASASSRGTDRRQTDSLSRWCVECEDSTLAELVIEA